MKRLLIFGLIWMFCAPLIAQKFDWVKFYQGQETQQLRSLNADKNGNVCFSINFTRQITSDTLNWNFSSAGKSFICKKDSSGATKWIKIARAAASNVSLTTLGSVFSTNGNMMIFLYSNGNITIGEDTVYRTGSGGNALFIVELNADGGLVSGRELINGSLINGNYIAHSFANDEHDNLYLSLKYNTATIYDTIQARSLPSQQLYHLIKFSKNGRVFEWSRSLPPNVTTNNVDVDVNGNVYLGTFWEGSPSSFTFKNQTISRAQNVSGCVFIFDRNGNDKNWFHILSSAGQSTVSGVAAHDSVSVFVTGYFLGDSARFDNKWKKVKTYGAYNFIALYQADGKMIWEKHEDTSSTTGFHKQNYYGSVSNFKNQFLYVSHFTHAPFGKIVYDGVKYHPGGTNWGMNLKVDDRGNILWGFRSFYPFSAMGTDDYSSLYFGGWFETDSVFFGPYKAKGDQGDALVGKTYDYAIFRGPVSYGPYCAGDTFKVPYTITGEFLDSNMFYAELSDEEGNFTGGERILGSIKSKENGIINGILPLFDVASSQKYRIRIRSTLPQVQSFYKLDTLRLLIYSKDDADPGPTEFICPGDTFKLQTFGGTKWTWSPGIRMSDSTSRTPMVWPLSDTQYKIIIDDSSGCGQADTAIKTIIIRKAPKANILNLKDTLVCKNSTVPLIAEFVSGDSLNYAWDWFSISKTGVFTYLKSSKNKLRDTFSFKLPADVNDSQQISVSIRDGCTPGSFPTYYTIKIRQDRVDAVFNETDTMICPGRSTNIVVHFKNGYKPGYNWQWYERNTFGQWVPGVKKSGMESDTLKYTLPLNWNKLKQHRVIFGDNCSPFADTAIYSILPRDTLRIQLNTKDTVMCVGQKYTWKAKGSGGYPPQYAYRWTDRYNGNILSLTDSLVFVADSAIQVMVNLYDNCMPDSHHLSFAISLYPALNSDLLNYSKLTALDTVLCYGQSLKFFSKAEGGKGNVYQYQWKFNGNVVSNKDSVEFTPHSFLPATGGSSTLELVLQDNCTVRNDSSRILVSMLPGLNIQAGVKDSVCFGDSAVFTMQGNGGNGNYSYRWLDENFQNAGSSNTIRTGNTDSNINGPVIRMAILSDGCTVPDDTAIISTLFLERLSLSLNSSDTCTNSALTFNALMTGGKGRDYTVSWWKGGDYILSNNGQLIVYPDAPLIKYRAVLSDGCSRQSDTAEIKAGIRPVLKLSAKGFCFTDSTFLKAGVLNPYKPSGFEWKIDNQILSDEDSILHRILPEAKQYLISVSSKDLNCRGTDTIRISVVEKPKADFNYTKILSTNAGIQFYFSNQSKNASNYYWQFNATDTSMRRNPSYMFSDTGIANVILVAGNKELCFDTIVKYFPVFNKLEFFYPNVFSPDGNGINDGFGLNPSQFRLVKEYKIEIFNRWGEKVFITEDASELWKPLESQIGVYIYKVYIRDIYDVLHELKGVVMLKE